MAAMGLAGFFVLFIFSDEISRLIGLKTSSMSIKATSFALIFVPLLAAYRGYFQGNNNMVPTAVSEIIEQLLRVAFGLLFAVLFIRGFGIDGSVNEELTKAQLHSRGAAGACMGASIGACGALIFISHKYRKEPCIRSGGSIDRNKDILHELLTISFPITLTAGVVSIVNLIDISIVQTQLLKLGYDYETSKSMFGELTGFAAPIVGIPLVLIQSIAISILPAISADNKQNFNKSVKTKIEEALNMACLIYMPCAVGLFVLSEPILRLLYGSQIHAASPSVACLKVYAVSFIFLSITTIASSVLQSLGKQNISTGFMLFGIIIKIALTWALTGVASINVMGAPLGTTAAYIIAAALDLLYLKKHTEYSGMIGSKLKAVTLAFFMGAIVKIVYIALDGFTGSGIALAASVASGVAVYYTAGNYFSIIPRELIDLFINRLKRIRT